MSLKPTNILLRGMEEYPTGSIETYQKVDGYKALEKALKEMSPQDVIDEVAKAGCVRSWNGKVNVGRGRPRYTG